MTGFKSLPRSEQKKYASYAISPKSHRPLKSLFSSNQSMPSISPSTWDRSKTSPSEAASRCGECGTRLGSRKQSPPVTRTSLNDPLSTVLSVSVPSSCAKNSSPSCRW